MIHDLWPKGVIKLNAIISVHSPNQEVLEYHQKHPLILHVQKFYKVHLAHSIGHDYLVLVQFDYYYYYYYYYYFNFILSKLEFGFYKSHI